jgi:hypothetical protein
MLVYHPHILLDAIDHVHTGQTALHKIAQKLHDASSVDEKARYVQCLHILLSSSNGQQSRDPGGSSSFVNVNAQDAFGNTALHYAALSGIYREILLRFIKPFLLSQALNIIVVSC